MAKEATKSYYTAVFNTIQERPIDDDSHAIRIKITYKCSSKDLTETTEYYATTSYCSADSTGAYVSLVKTGVQVSDRDKTNANDYCFIGLANVFSLFEWFYNYGG